MTSACFGHRFYLGEAGKCVDLVLWQSIECYLVRSTAVTVLIQLS